MNIRTGWRIALAAAFAMLSVPAFASGPYSTADLPRNTCVVDIPASQGTAKAQCVTLVDQEGNSVNGDSRPVAVSITARDVATSTASGQNSVAIVSGTPTAGSSQDFAINGRSAVRVTVSGTWTGTGQFEGSLDDGATYVAIPLRVVGTVYTGSTFTANGSFYGDVAGLTNLRVRSTAAQTGTITVKATFAATGGPVQVLNPVRIVDNASGNSLALDGSGRPTVNQAAASVVPSSAVEACHVFKASPGTLYGFTVNTTASATANDWIMLFDATSAPADGAVTPKDWAGRISASGTAGYSIPGGIAFSTGIVACLSTTGPLTKTAEAQAVFSGKVQ